MFDFLLFLPCNGVLSLLLMDDLLHLVFDLPEFFHLRMDGRKLRLPGLVLLFQTVTLLAPCGDGQLAILEIRLQLALCHVIQAECVFIFGHELLLLAFPFDGCQLVRNGLALGIKLHHAEKLVQLFHAVRFAAHRVFQSVDVVTQNRHTLLQFLRCCQLVLYEIIANLVELFEIADLRFLAPSPGVANGNNGNIIFLKMGNLKFPNLGGLIFLFL